MTPQKNRATKKNLDRIWRQGRSIRSGSLNFRFLVAQTTQPAKISFIIPKTVGTAVLRNTLRRRGYGAIRSHLARLPRGLVGAMVYSPKKESEKNFTQINTLVSDVFKGFL